MATIPKQAPIIQPLHKDWYEGKVQCVDMLRLDMIHPVVSGNKWYKLQYNVQHALDNGFRSILTFGGSYSNHLVATAAVAKASGIASIGIVRGGLADTETLKACESYGMQLVHVSREDYNRKTEEEYLAILADTYHNAFIIPEGGANEQGRMGTAEIAALIPNNYTHVCVSVGTGTTFIGLRNALPIATVLYGYAPMKGGAYLIEDIISYLQSSKNINWQLFDNWHYGGFGKHTDEQLAFMNTFYAQNNIPLDVVYTSKMMTGVKDQIHEDVFHDNARILCIHTGGLQGNSSVAGKLNY